MGEAKNTPANWGEALWFLARERIRECEHLAKLQEPPL